MSTSALAGPLLAGAGLLAAAGVAKAARPHDTARALRRAGLPFGAAAVRAGAVVEVVIGVCATFLGGAVPAAAVGVSYLGFAVFVGVALARGWSLASCGCFGEPDSAPTPLHVAVDASLGATALLAAAAGGPAPLVLAARRPAWGSAMVALAVVTGGLAYLALARLGKLRSVR